MSKRFDVAKIGSENINNKLVKAHKINNYEVNLLSLVEGVDIEKPIKGEEEFLGKGVEYCTTCNESLYKDKIVTIIGYSNHKETEANFIATIALQVHYIPMYDNLVDLDPSIELLEDTPMEIVGENFVEKLILKNRKIETDIIFILRDM